jgi:hypothetical protein
MGFGDERRARDFGRYHPGAKNKDAGEEGGCVKQVNERDDQPWVLGKALDRAHWRCRRIAVSEELLGYHDSARDYEAIADELEGLASWVLQVKLASIAA